MNRFKCNSMKVFFFISTFAIVSNVTAMDPPQGHSSGNMYPYFPYAQLPLQRMTQRLREEEIRKLQLEIQENERVMHKFQLKSQEKIKRIKLEHRFTSAARDGHKEDIKAPLNAGVDINSRDTRGNTALILASEFGHKEIVKMLLNAGADKNAQNEKGNTALTTTLQAQAQYQDLLPSSRDCYTEIIKMLKAGSNIDSTGSESYISPFMTAEEIAEVEVRNALLAEIAHTKVGIAHDEKVPETSKEEKYEDIRANGPNLFHWPGELLDYCDDDVPPDPPDQLYHYDGTPDYGENDYDTTYDFLDIDTYDY